MSTRTDSVAELVILGRMLEGTGDDFVSTAVSTIGPHALVEESHRIVFSAIAAVHAAGDPVDMVSVAAELTARGQLAQVGGATALAKLTEASLSSAARAPQLYLGKLADNERMRALQQGLDVLGSRMRDGTTDLTVDEIKAQVDALFDSPSFQALTLVDIDTQLKALWATLGERRENKTGLGGVPTGWADLDGDPKNRDAMALVKGLKPGWLVVLAARPGSGKTTSLIDWIRAAATADCGAVLFTLEMTAAEIVELLVIAECGTIHRDKLKDPNLLSSNGWDMVSEAIARIAKWPLIIDDTSESLPEFRRVAAAARAKFRAEGKDLHIVYEDYVQLTKTPGGRGNVSRSEEVSSFAKGFKKLAKDMMITCVVAAQFNRAAAENDRPPRLNDLKESGALEEDADLVIGLHRPFAVNGAAGGDTPDDMTVLLLKSRHSQGGAQFRRTFLGEFARTSEPLARIPYDSPPR